MMNLQRCQHLPPATAAIAAALLLMMVNSLLSAWLCDDAYITFRTVENLVAGDGPR